MTKKKQQPPRYVASKREAGTKPREASARKKHHLGDHAATLE